jgi:uncharacterized protein YrrD
MRKGKDVIGKDIVSFIDGKKAYSVKDLLIGLDNRGIVALLVDEGGLFSSSRIVPLANVVSYGKDAVVISEAAAVVPADTYPAVQEIISRKDSLTGKKVLTEGGDEHGKISDVYFEEQTGEIIGYEVSEGFFKDVATGSGYLGTDDIVNLGQDVVLIKSEAVYKLDAQTGGIQAKLQDAGEKVGQAADTVKEKAGQAAESVKEKAGQASDRIGSSIGSQPEDAVGKRAMYNVEAENGSYIVVAGQRVTQRDVERARRNNRVDHLLVATGVKSADEVGEGVDLGAMRQQAGEKLGEAGEKIGTTAEAAADKTGQVWDDFVSKVRDWKDSAGQRLDEEKTKRKLDEIHEAIGRPTTKVILDKEDNVILNLGEIITHSAVQRAFEAGMLDTLLANSYKGDVYLTQDDLRAPTEGEATIQKSSGGADVVEKMEQKVEAAEQDREQDREQSRMEAEQKREQNEQEREMRAQERETKQQQSKQEKKSQQGENNKDQPGGSNDDARVDMQPRGGQSGTMASKGSGGSPLEGADTESHQQASIPDSQFDRGGSQSTNP